MQQQDGIFWLSHESQGRTGAAGEGVGSQVAGVAAEGQLQGPDLRLPTNAKIDDRRRILDLPTV